MATIAFDGQSFLINDRRIWLVSGAMHYSRIPRDLWRSRIAAARQAGLNCIEVSCVWNQHEPRPGRLQFDGNLDLRTFIRMLGDERMYCILRPGPYLGSHLDFGGLPPWLHRVPNMRIREANGPFLEASSRYLGAVMSQVQDLQVTTMSGTVAIKGDRGGPIIMIEAESAWFCDNPPQITGYLGELTRYLRENGCTVPIADSNNLWARIDQTISCWKGGTDLAANVRQLRIVQPEAPRIAIGCPAGTHAYWGSPPGEDVGAEQYARMLASVLAVGGQYNIDMFHGGTNFGFLGGRSVQSPFSFATTSNDCAYPLGETGERTEKYLATKRISMFANHFGALLANLEPDAQHTAVTPDGDEQAVSVIHQHGKQGDVVFVFKGSKSTITESRMLLPNGLTLPVPLGSDPVAWFCLNADLGGVARLTFTNLRPWALVDRKLLVLFGPAGADGVVSINDAPVTFKVPTGQSPRIQSHEQITLLVLNREQVDAAYVCPDGVAIGASGLDVDLDLEKKGEPAPLAGWPQTLVVLADGSTRTVKRKAQAPPRPGDLMQWEQADLGDLVTGAAQSYQPIDGPASLSQLECDHGYGWYRVSLKKPFQGRALVPLGGDRLHVYNDGKLDTIVGLGPMATSDPMKLRIGDSTVVLADNLGRYSEGWSIGEPKGLFGHVYTVKSVRLGKPAVHASTAPDLFALGGHFSHARADHEAPADELTWQIKPEGRNAMVLDIDRLPGRAMLLVNGEPIGAYCRTLSAGWARFVLEVGEHLTGGRNELKLALFQRYRNLNLASHLTLYQTTGAVTAKASWAFAHWTKPDDAAFSPLGKSVATLQPRWFRGRFRVNRTDAPLWFHPRGLSKGHLFINGHDAGRYFVSTHTGRTVPPQEHYYLPEPWLRTDEPNELLLFDEHGRHPGRSRVVSR